MRKHLYLIGLFVVATSNLLVAQKAPAWGGGADVNDWSFGFSFSFINSYFKIDKQPNWRDPFIDPETGLSVAGPLNYVRSPNAPGFAAGFLARYRITDHLEVRTNPTIIFADRKLIYSFDTTDPDKQLINKNINANSFDVPLQLKLKSDRIGDFRGYLIGGAKLTTSLGFKRNDDANKALIEKSVKNRSMFASYEVGVGCDIYFEFFKLSPEIKLSNSFGSILQKETHPYSTPLKGLSLQTIQFSLYFE